MGPIELNETVTRYLFSRQFNKEKGRVKPAALLPRELPKNIQKGSLPPEVISSGIATSVFRIALLKDKDIWDLGNEKVASKKQHSLKARADIIVKDIFEVNLNIAGISNHSLHASIYGWPNNSEEDEDGRNMAHAILLAKKCKLHINPTGLNNQ